MPKTIHTPRNELICGKLDELADMIRDVCPEETALMLFLIEEIRHDAQRMEAKLIERKQEANKLKKRA